MYREAFAREAVRLFPAALWQEAGRSDNDPAQPQGE
jgi:hypothetical protein